jgi:hypothetical protein
MQLLADQMIATIEGRLVAADALSQELYTVWRRAGMPEATTYRATTALGSGREQGRLASMLRGWERFVGIHPDAFSSIVVVAFTYAEMGELDRAAMWLEKVTTPGVAAVPADAGWPMVIAFATEVAAVLGERAVAADLHAAAVSMDTLQMATGGVSCGPVARLLARLEILLGRPDDADGHFAAAVDQSRRLGSPVWVARTLFDWADALADRGDVATANARADEGEAAIRGLSVPRLQQQSEALRARL